MDPVRLGTSHVTFSWRKPAWVIVVVVVAIFAVWLLAS